MGGAANPLAGVMLGSHHRLLLFIHLHIVARPCVETGANVWAISEARRLYLYRCWSPRAVNFMVDQLFLKRFLGDGRLRLSFNNLFSGLFYIDDSGSFD